MDQIKKLKNFFQKEKTREALTNQIKKLKVVYIIFSISFIFLISFFIKAINQYYILHSKVRFTSELNPQTYYDLKKTYNKIHFEPYISHHIYKKVDESPLEVISEFRGDTKKTGVYSGAVSFTNQSINSLLPNINMGLHSASKSTPAVDESGIYVGSDDSWFYKIDHNGKLVWKTYFANTSYGIHGTALLSKKYLWIGAYNGTLYCLKKTTGKVMWAIRLGDAIGASPTFFNDQIIISVEMENPPRGFVASVSAIDGSLKWKSDTTFAHIHSSVSIDSVHKYGITGANNGKLFKIDLNTGELLWTLQLSGAIKSTALIKESYIYITNLGNEFVKIHRNGKILWKININNRSQSSPTWIPDKKYLLFSTHWSKQAKSKPYLFAVSADSGKVIWKKHISNKRALASGISFFSKIHNKYLFIFPCEEQTICFINPEKGKVLKKINTNFLLTGSFTLFKESFFMSFNHGGLLSLGAK